jgi:hypothetical protein
VYENNQFHVEQTGVFLESDPSRYDFYAGSNHTAIRHANGRDWWIIVPHVFADKYYVNYLNTEDFTKNSTQSFSFDSLHPMKMINFMSMSASTQGDKIAVYRLGGLQLYDFDRCTGQLSNRKSTFGTPEFIPENGYLFFTYGSNPADLHKQFITTKFSPNDQYLYMKVMDSLFQLDISLPDSLLYKERKLVATTFPEGYLGFPGDSVVTLNLSKNREIYGQAKHGVYGIQNAQCHLSTIENLNAPADSVIFNYEEYFFPGTYINSRALSNPVDYDLGVLAGSGCDTIVAAPTGFFENLPTTQGDQMAKPYTQGVSTQSSSAIGAEDVQFWPNPATKNIVLRGNVGQGTMRVRVFDVALHEFFDDQWPNDILKYTISVSGWSPGVYFIVLQDERGSSSTQRVVVTD